MGRLRGGWGHVSLAWLPNRRQCHRSQTLLLLADGGWPHNARVPARPACVLSLGAPGGQRATAPRPHLTRRRKQLHPQFVPIACL